MEWAASSSLLPRRRQVSVLCFVGGLARRFFSVDVESKVIAIFHTLAQTGQPPGELVSRAISDLGMDPEIAFPKCV